MSGVQGSKPNAKLGTPDYRHLGHSVRFLRKALDRMPEGAAEKKIVAGVVRTLLRKKSAARREARADKRAVKLLIRQLEAGEWGPED